jgi:hypothetical protein
MLSSGATRYLVSPDNPAPPNPPLSRRCEEERDRSERKKGWFIRGRNLGVRSQKERNET